MSNNWKHVKKILISRSDSIGDVVLSLPLAGYLKTIIPDAEIHFLAQEYTRDVVACEQHIDQFVSYDQLKVAYNPIEKIENLSYDVVIHVFPRRAIATWCQKAKIPVRVGTSHRIFHWWTVNKKLNFTRKRSDLHESQLNFKLAEALNMSIEPSIDEVYKYLNFKVQETELPINITAEGKNIILHPGSKGSAINWSFEKYAELARALAEREVHVWFTGTEEEGNEWNHQLFESEYINDTSGKMTLRQLIAFINNSHGLVACSTGPLHIAGILGVRTVGLFSPKRPIHPGRWKPLGPNVQTIVHDQDCENCKENKDCNCINKISVDEVIDKLEL